MYLAIRRLTVQPDSTDEVIRRVENGLVPILSSVPGFVEYVGVHIGEGSLLSISIFETKEQAEESSRRAADWVKQNLAPFSAGPHEIVAVGDVRVRQVKMAE